MTDFVHLHTHTEHSALDGLSKVTSDFVREVENRGQCAVAITDHGSLGGALRLAHAAQGTSVKPILGEELYVSIGDRFERNTVQVPRDDDDGVAGDEDPEAYKQSTSSSTKRKAYEHITVLAQNEAGWRNLVTMGNRAQDSYWVKPRIDYELLAEHADGLITLTGCLAGPVAGPLARGEKAQADANLAMLVERMGRENVYVEMMDHGIASEQRILEDLVVLADKYKVGIVATNDSHYTNEADAHAHDALLCVQTHSRLSDRQRFRFNGHGYHLRTAAEMLALRGDTWWTRAVETSVEIADRIDANVLGDNSGFKLPKFPLLPDEYPTSEKYLHHLMLTGARELYETDERGRLPVQVRERLRYEYDVICQMGMADYMLIVWEMVSWARSQGILVGPGRGSAAGSIAAYVLGITKVEPISNRLLFERFLDPSRIGMPDVDTDFEGRRRHEVHAHLLEVYGRDRVARIGQRGILRTKAAIERAAHVLGRDEISGRLKALLPAAGAAAMPFNQLDQRPDTSKAFWGFVAEDESLQAQRAAESEENQIVTAPKADAGQVVDLARQFEGVTRSVGHHPCGVLISDRDLTPVVPMRYERSKGGDPVPGSLRVAEWDGEDLERLGYVKLDVLGIKNLDQMARTVRYIKATTGETVDVENLNPGCGDARDAATWRLIGEGKTSSVFQLSSRGMTELATAVQPDRLDDLTALVALYRPGPMAAGMHHRYADRKNGLEDTSVDYLTTIPTERDVIAPVLESTMGVILYQEDLMLLGEVVGGLDAGWKNRLRKAFSKKKADEMQAVHDKFVAGALAGDNPTGTVFTRETVDRLWRTFEGSASYLFNRSHAAAYGLIAYMTAYLKANWPSQYGAAVLAETSDRDKRAAVFAALSAEGVVVVQPDVNRSAAVTSSVDGVVMLGLGEIKGMSSAGAAAIAAEREKNGPFASLHDLLVRVGSGSNAGSVKSSDVEALIEAGALDQFGPRLGMMLTHKAAAVTEFAPLDANWCPLDQSRRQRERLGLAIGQHPLKVLAGNVRAEMARMGATARHLKSLEGARDRGRYSVVGVVAAFEVKPYSRGRLANVRLEASDGFQMEVTAWDSELTQLEQAGIVPTVGDVCLVHLRASTRTRLVEVTDEETGETRAEHVTSTSFSVDSLARLDVGVPASWACPGSSVQVARDALPLHVAAGVLVPDGVTPVGELSAEFLTDEAGVWRVTSLDGQSRVVAKTPTSDPVSAELWAQRELAARGRSATTHPSGWDALDLKAG